jgi:hypothetical protein
MPIIIISTHNYLQGCHEPWGWVNSKDKSLQDVFTKEMHSKFDIDLKSIDTNVDLSLNINNPQKGHTHLMGSMTHDNHGMLSLFKWNNLGRLLYYVLRRVHSWCQISAFKVGTIKTFFFSTLLQLQCYVSWLVIQPNICSSFQCLTKLFPGDLVYPPW